MIAKSKAAAPKQASPMTREIRAIQLQPQLEVTYRKVSGLRPYPRNARTHSKHQIRQIADSMRAFGFTNPVLVDLGGQIVAGHGRVEAAKLLGMEEVPTIILEQLTNDEVRAYIIADNKLAENAGWDKDILEIELQYLINLEIPSFEVTVTGFEIAEIDLIIGGNAPSDPETAVELPDREQSLISQPGDLWQLDLHRVYCGNALQDASYKALMGAKYASAVFTDPPYNVKIDGHATGNGVIQHREFAMASGEMTDAEFCTFLKTFISLLIRYSTSQSVQYLCIDWRHIQALLAVGEVTYGQLLNVCVWVKDKGGMGSMYRSQHEMVAVFRSGKKSHRNNIQLGKFGRNRTNVWQYPGVQTQSRRGDEGNLLALHPTVKPIAMVADALLDCTKRGDLVLDTFLGSGTTLMAAQRIGRTCYGMELDPLYVDTAIRRWQQHTGSSAVHAVSGKTFDQVVEERLATNG